jgi:glutamate 5-kinase
VVLKVGSAVLTSEEGDLDEAVIRRLVSQVSFLVKRGWEFVVVSSGAIAAGRAKLGRSNIPKTIPYKQAAAAVGQSHLVWAYEKSFRRSGIQVAQILLTHDDLGHRNRYLNARNTLHILLENGVVPIVNENDTVAVEEIKFGDNDILSAFVADLVKAELLLILTDIEGFFTADPRREPGAQLIPLVEKVTPQLESMAGKSSTQLGTGGMQTKLEAVRKAALSGIPTVIAEGGEANVIKRVLKGEEIGSLFLPGSVKLKGKKPWIAHHLRPKGYIIIDNGARKALVNNGKSLLPTGITGVEGGFKFGDLVACLDVKGVEVARGLVNYSSEELQKIRGRHTSEIEGILGFKTYDEVIHRDDMVILGDRGK